MALDSSIDKAVEGASRTLASLEDHEFDGRTADELALADSLLTHLWPNGRDVPYLDTMGLLTDLAGRQLPLTTALVQAYTYVVEHAGTGPNYQRANLARTAPIACDVMARVSTSASHLISPGQRMYAERYYGVNTAAPGNTMYEVVLLGRTEQGQPHEVILYRQLPAGTTPDSRFLDHEPYTPYSPGQPLAQNGFRVVDADAVMCWSAYVEE